MQSFEVAWKKRLDKLRRKTLVPRELPELGSYSLALMSQVASVSGELVVR